MAEGSRTRRRHGRTDNVGAALAMAMSGRVTERLGGGLTSLLGGSIMIVSVLPTSIVCVAPKASASFSRDGNLSVAISLLAPNSLALIR